MNQTKPTGLICIITLVNCCIKINLLYYNPLMKSSSLNERETFQMADLLRACHKTLTIEVPRYLGSFITMSLSQSINIDKPIKRTGPLTLTIPFHIEGGDGAALVTNLTVWEIHSIHGLIFLTSKHYINHNRNL